MKDKEIQDWEYDDNFYSESARESKELKFEDFLNDSIEESGFDSTTNSDEEFNKVLSDVKKVKLLLESGKSVADMAKELSIDESYCSLIAMCILGVGDEPSDEGITHLVMMDL